MSDKFFPIETKHFFIKPQKEEMVWGDPWEIRFKNGDQNSVGKIGFEDTIFHGEVAISLDLDAPYEKSGYNEEILFSVSRAVFRFRNVNEVSTSCRHEDDYKVKGLEKAGFVRRETKDGVDYYSIKKQKSGWTGLYIILGMCAGFMVGILISNLWIGTIASVLIGAIMGIIMDKRVDTDKNRPA
ncbi:hypothetical protein [Butyrivibrio sp. VCD2006]|uniref:hypothetical protein n=1 Tax=Butyrivibrio sp. VCD2006 TaxID=1280664 RepID=UPI0004252AE6|nr:hypothetical protein [Butyrivibrio sp. VCD2006]